MIIDCRQRGVAIQYRRSRAYLDGLEVEDCFYVDTDEGTVGHYVRDPRLGGLYMIDFDTGRPLEAWAFEGNVEIVEIP